MRFLSFLVLMIVMSGCVQSQLEAQTVSADTIKDCDVCPELVVIPAGRFLLGSPANETGRDERWGDEDDQEGPGGSQVPVTIDYSFAVSRTEVTWEEWDACVAAGGCDGAGVEEAGGAEGWGKGNRPVTNVSWADAKDYAAWLSEKTGKDYRLLTEAEWEYAARAGTTTRFSFGEDISPMRANYDYLRPVRDAIGRTMPVGLYEPNNFGLYDVHGNVWEWVEDCYIPSYADNPGNGSARTAETDCGDRILRGGSWYDAPQYLRSADRLVFGPDFRFKSLGIRLARTVN